MKEAARIPVGRQKLLKRNLLLLASYLAIMTLIAGAYF
jgi:hypothetical protein